MTIITEEHEDNAEGNPAVKAIVAETIEFFSKKFAAGIRAGEINTTSDVGNVISNTASNIIIGGCQIVAHRCGHPAKSLSYELLSLCTEHTDANVGKHMSAFKNTDDIPDADISAN